MDRTDEGGIESLETPQRRTAARLFACGCGESNTKEGIEIMPGTANSGGRNAKPPKVHLLQGTFQRVRHAGHDVPEPPPGRPTPPKPLTGVAKAEWERMVARMEQSKTLSIVDDAALYQYVQLHTETEAITEDAARLQRLSADLKRAARKLDGTNLVEAIGRIVELQRIIAKQTQQLRQGHMAIRQYLVEFGMTPSARTRVKLPPADQKVNKLARLMGQTGA
jgi:P27 family predicted phage terminase small subunit